MKKKLIGIISACVVVCALLGVGLFLATNKNETATVETGKKFTVEWYNEKDKEFTITTVEQLYEFAQLSDFYTFEDQTIILGADLVVNEGNAKDWAKDAPARRWKPIKNFAGTFDGQGHSISGVYGKGHETPLALFVDTSRSCTIQNLKLTNSYFEGSGNMGTASFTSNGGGKFLKLYSDAIISVNGENAAGISSMVDNQSTFEECWYAGEITITNRDAGGIIDTIAGSRVTMKHCLFSGVLNCSYDFGGTRVGGLIGTADKMSTVLLTDSLSSGIINCDKNVYTGSMVGAAYAGSEWTITDVYIAADTYGTIFGESGNKGTYTGNALSLRRKELIGMKGYQWTTLDFDAYWAVVENDTPVLKAFAENALSISGVKKAFDTSWYNAGTGIYNISTLEHLYGIYILSAQQNFQNRIFKLENDIVVNEGKVADWVKNEPEVPWYSFIDFEATFDGQGHTISGIYQKGTNSYMGLFSRIRPNGVVKNLSLKNSYFHNTHETYSAIGSVAGECYGTLQNIYSNAIVIAHGNQAGGIVGRSNDNDKDGKVDNVLISNCWFDGSLSLKGEKTIYGGGIVGNLVQGDLTMEHCLNTGTISTEATGIGLHVGGLLGNAWGAGVFNLSDSLNVGKIVANYKVCVGSVIGRLRDETHTANIKNTYTTKESHEIAIGTATKATINGGVIQLEESWYKGYDAYRWTELDFPNYWAIVKTGTPILQTFATSDPSTKGIAKMVDTSWYKADAKTMTIDSVADIYGLAMLAMANDFKGQTVKLAKDLTMDPTLPWIPIGNTSKPFAGTFDGQGHTIKNMNVVSETTHIGLFGVTYPTSMLKNFKLVDSSFTYNGPSLTEEGKEVVAYLGSVCGDLRGDMENVYSNAKVTSTASRVGGLVAVANGAKLEGEPTTCTIKNCWFDGEVKLTGKVARYAGGIAGVAMQNGIEIIHCLNTGKVSNERLDAAQFLGGILGMEQNKSQVLIKDSLNAGIVSAANYNGVGSIVGMMYHKESDYVFEDVYATNESCTYPNGTVTTYRKYRNHSITGSPLAFAESYLLGTEGYKWTTLDFANYWVVRNAKVPALKSFAAAELSTAGIGRIDTSWYDANKKEHHIKDLMDLYGFAVLVKGGISFEGHTVCLDADIKVNDVKAGTLDAWKQGTEVPKNTWIPIGNASTLFKGTFDGKDHTISGVYLDTEETYAGFFGATHPTAMLKNFKLTDSYLKYSGSNLDENGKEIMATLGSVCGDLRGDMQNVYSNAYVTSAASRVGGLVAIANGAKLDGKATTCTITNCWFDGEVKLTGAVARYAGGIAAISMQNGVEIINCLNTGAVSNERTNAAQFLGGILGSEQNKSDIRIKDCLNAGVISAASYNGVGSVVGMAYLKDSSYTFDNTYATNESCIYPGNVVTTYRNYKCEHISGTPIALPRSNMLGVEGYKWTNLDFTNYWVARNANVPALKLFAGEGVSIAGVIKPDTSWYDKEATELHIKDEADFFGFAALAKEGKTFAGKTVYLDADLILNEVAQGTLDAWKAGTETAANTWVPIGDTTTVFQGTFDGQGHSISGAYLNTEGLYSGLFGVTGPASMLKNFKLIDSYFAYSGPSLDASDKEVYAALGSVCGDLRGDMQNVYSNAYVSSTASRVGGLVAIANGAKLDGKLTTCSITNCWFDGEVKLTGSNARYAGGIAGIAMQGTIELSNCLNTGNVSNERTSAAQFVGGILGTEWNACTVTIKDCLNTGNVTAANYNGVGSVVGMLNVNGSIYTFDNAYATNESCIYPNNVVTTHRVYKCVDINGVPSALEAPSLKDTNAYKNTMLDFYLNENEAGAWVARTADYPALKTFADASTVASLSGVSQDGWYNDAVTEYYISSASEFRGFRDIVNSGKNFKDKIVYLTANIDLNPGWTAPKSATEAVSGNPTLWTSIGNNNSADTTTRFYGVFDGQGHEVKGVYVVSSATYAGLFGYVDGAAAVVKNVRLTNSYVEYTGTSVFNGGIAGYLNKGTISGVYCNAIVKSSGTEFGGIVGRAEGLVEECWFDGIVYADRTDATYIKAGGVVGTSWSQTGTGKPLNPLTIKNCLNTGEVIYHVTTTSGAGSGIGGIYGGDRGYTVLTVENCINIGMITSNQANGSGSVVGNVSKNTSINSVATYSTATITNCYGAKDTITAHLNDKYDGRILGYKNANCTVTESGNGIKELAELKGDAVYNVVDDGGLDLDFDVWVARKEAVPVPRRFVGTGVAEDVVIEDKSRVVSDTSWLNEHTGTQNDPYEIETAGDLLGLAKLVNDGNTFQGKYIVITNDLDMNPGWTASINYTTGALNGNAPKNQWPVIGDGDHKFAGILDGKGHTISGIYVYETTWHAGLFGYIGDNGVGEVKNLQLVNSYIKGEKDRVGGLAGVVAGKVSNVYVAAYVIGDTFDIGGITGRMQGSGTKIIDNCWFDGYVGRHKTATTTSHIGGIVGNSAGGTNKITNCLNSGKVYNEYTTTNANQSSGTGGIVGTHSSAGGTTVEKCLNVGVVTTPNHVFASNAKRSHRGMGPIIGYISKSGSVANIKDCIWTNVAELDETDVNDMSNGLVYQATLNESGTKQYSDIAALNTAVNANETAVMVLGFGEDGAWTRLRVQENNQPKDLAPIPKVFKTWWVDYHNYSKNLLMIGNSFCYYYVEELYGIAEASGIHLNIYNVYYSGCSLESHWNWLQNDTRNYDFYVTNAEGRRKAISDKANLKECLAVADWDIISIQDASSANLTTYDELLNHGEPYAGKMYEFLRQQFPSARYLWQHIWAYEVGYTDSNNPIKNVPDTANQLQRYNNYLAVSNFIRDKYHVDVVPSGDAWKNARTDALIGDTLCGRISTGDLVHGDYYHDGDVGGGQYLNACVWFETLTGQSPVGNTYRPDYDLSEAKIQALQGYAHEAVKAIYGTNP